jgi:hypothetical protein
MYVFRVKHHTAPRPRPLAAFALLGVILFACGEQEDWSPLDGPWDPDHPRAAEILAAPPSGAPIDDEMAEAGARWYRIRGCMACHTVDGTEVVGPTLLGVTSLRDYDWFRGMVMNPDSMFINDAEARALLDLYPIPMPDQGVDELRTRAIWEYLRRVDREARMDRDDG